MTQVLVVDGNAENRSTLQGLLQDHGYEVIASGNGKEALAEARRQPPDVVISDVRMPVMDGFTLCRQWEADARLSAIPFVFYTATPADAEDEELGLSLGAERFITEPQEPDMLLAILEDVIANHGAGGVPVPCGPGKETDAPDREGNDAPPQATEDRTERPSATVAGRIEELRILNRLAERMSNASSLDEVTGAVMDEVMRGVAPDVVLVYLLEGDKQRLRGTRPDRSEFAAMGTKVERVGECLCGLAAAGEPVYSTDISADSRCTLEDCRRAGIRSFAALPLRRGERIFGVLGVASRTPRDMRENAVFLEALAGSAALGVQSAALHEEVHRHVAHLEEQLTERMRAEKELRRARQDWEDIFHAIGQPTLILDRDHRILLANRAMTQLVDRSEAELVGKTCYEVIHGTGAPPAKCPMERMLRSNEPATVEMEMEAAGRTFLVSCTPVRDDYGDTARVIHIATDITDQKHMEARLRYTNRALQVLSQCNEALIRATDEAQLLHQVCRVIVEGGGYRLAWVGYAENDAAKTVRPVAEEGLDDGYLESSRVTWADDEHGRGPTGTAIRTGEPSVVRDLLTAPGFAPWRAEAAKRGYASLVSLPLGSPAPARGALVIYAAEPDAFDENEVKLLLDLAHDLVYGIDVLRAREKHRQAEEALRASERGFRAVFDNAMDGILISDATGNAFYAANRRICEMLGYSQEEMRRLTVRDLHPSDDVPLALSHFDRMARGHASIATDIPMKRKDGSTLYADISASPMAFAGRKCVIGIFRDITERKRSEEERQALEAQLLQAQKMEAVGTLAGGVAHDFNNLLTTISGFADLSLARLTEDSPVYEDLRQVLAAAERASNLVRQLLLFSRRQPMEFKPLDVGRIVDDLVKMLDRLIGEDVTVEAEHAAGLWVIRGDAGSLEQVLMNLSVNARDAMPGGGRLHIATENVVLGKEDCHAIPGAKPGRFVRLSVSDTGAGMGKGTIERIFEPFFTTKDIGEGTGLGLSVVYGIVRQHKGWINVYSEPGRGTAFRVYLPAAYDLAGEDAEEEAPLESLRGRGETVLVVEDEEELRAFGVRVLTEMGYAVLDAGDAQQALALAEREQGPIDLVFCDCVLPDQTGIQLVERLLQLRPDLRVVLTSGYTDDKSQWALIRDRGYVFIQKPYRLADLLQSVRKQLDRKD